MNDDIKTMRDLVDKTGDIGIECKMYLPNGEVFEHNRLINIDTIEEFITNDNIRRFYSDDTYYAFATALKEAGYGPQNEKTPQPG